MQMIYHVKEELNIPLLLLLLLQCQTPKFVLGKSFESAGKKFQIWWKIYTLDNLNKYNYFVGQFISSW